MGLPLRPRLALVALTVTVAASPAAAKSASELHWPYEQIFGAAIRFVRVDRACKIVDRDEAAGFVVFECPDDTAGKPPHRGALEIFKVQGQGRPAVRVQLSLPDDPRYVELRFLELLERKIKEERGVPPSAAPPKPPLRPSPDGGQ